MSASDYRRMSRPGQGQKWRRRARAAILDAIDTAEPGLSPEALLKHVDAAYPFGERAMAPYKAWLAERKLLRECLFSPVAPSADEAAVCEVARDMELEGRIDEAKALLEQAPNRLAMRCPACGIPPGVECFDVDHGPSLAAYRPGNMCFPTLLVPHQARLVGHLGAGPLFDTRGGA